MREKGEAGEDLAAKYLKQLGWRIIKRNYRCPMGEIDIIAEDGDTVVFVEVKARAKGAMVSASESVNVRKQEKLSSVAMHYLGTLGRKGGPPPARFDVIGVSIREGETEDIEHLKDAFSLGSGDALWA